MTCRWGYWLRARVQAVIAAGRFFIFCGSASAFFRAGRLVGPHLASLQQPQLSVVVAAAFERRCRHARLPGCRRVLLLGGHAGRRRRRATAAERRRRAPLPTREAASRATRSRCTRESQPTDARTRKSAGVWHAAASFHQPSLFVCACCEHAIELGDEAALPAVLPRRTLLPRVLEEAMVLVSCMYGHEEAGFLLGA